MSRASPGSCRLSTLLALGLLPACSGGEARGDGGGLSGSWPSPPGSGEASTGGETSTGDETTTSAATSGDAASGAETSTTDPPGGTTSSTGDLPPVRSCTYRSTNFGAAPAELMVDKGSAATLDFTIPDLPPPDRVVNASLVFVGHDLDHPGEEGVVVVNGGAPIDLPAELAWENADQAITLDITGRTVEGSNDVSFGAGSFEGGTFYRISAVAAQVDAHVDACPEAPAGPPMSAQIGYQDATYGERHNWVLRCDFGEGYAFTAKGADQIPLDCGGLYAPDGKRTGTATFTFVDLAPATYRVSIRSRHSVNRNPKGALFVVDGEGRRVPQNDDQDFVTDIWGDKALVGTVHVVLDSTQEGESDSVTWVRLDPL